MRIIFFIARKITKVLNEKISECFVREPCVYEVWRLITVQLNPRLKF